jgi:hypothetical protein
VSVDCDRNEFAYRHADRARSYLNQGVAHQFQNFVRMALTDGLYFWMLSGSDTSVSHWKESRKWRKLFLIPPAQRLLDVLRRSEKGEVMFGSEKWG